MFASVGSVGRVEAVSTHATGVPWWAGSAHVVDGVRPGFFLDVLNGRYALGGTFRSLTDLLTVTNASAIRTYIDQSGVIQTASANTPRLDWANGVRELLLEGASTNLFLNSATLSTQSVTTTATAYALSFWGTGTVTMSGAYSGSLAGTGANTRVTKTFTAVAGTITFTVTGSVTNAQFEAGSGVTSYIQTTSIAVTRTADLCQLSTAAAAVLMGAGAAVAWRGNVPIAKSGYRLLAAQGAVNLIRPYNTDPTQMMMDGPVSSATIYASGVTPGDVGTCYGWGSSGGIASNNGSSPVTVGAGGTLPTSIYIGTSTGLSAGQVLRLRQLVGWTLPDRPSAAAVQAQARTAS